MRYIMLAAMLVALIPVANAQMPQGSTGGGSHMNNRQSGTAMQPSSPMASQPGAENCGTPDEPKSCPPMPRHPLASYPANKQ